jgi:lipooligosaccharide transport system permease protein
MMIVAMLMGVWPASVLSAGLLLGLMILVGVMFASLAMIVTSFSPSFDFFNYYTELVITPMLFFSGVFFPLDRFPAWMRTLSEFLPLTHAVKVSRAVYEGVFDSGLIWRLLVIIVLEAVAFIVSLRAMKRRLIK